MTTPNQLKSEFKELFEKQRAIENDLDFQAKKREYNDQVLESKYDLTTLSEIFQDPDLLSRISNEMYSFIKLRERSSRVRGHLDLVTTKKPQAKDVSTNRIIADEELQRIKALEENNNNPNEYISPIASKKRKYLATETVDIVRSPLLSGIEEEEKAEELVAQPNATIVTINSTLALPSVWINDNNTTPTEQQENDESPLEKSFEETALLFDQSFLKTVGSKYLYTLLPRQCDINAYKYVKDDYTPQITETSDESNSLDDTLITITIFNPKKTNKKFQEIEILGSQSLSDIRDCIYCLSDFSSNGDKLNKSPTGEIINTTEKKLSPAIIYIDHVFYIDTRLEHQPATYYDDLIDAWLTKKDVNKRVFKYQKKNMQDVLFEDTPLQLHKPFVFIHQDKCEHMVLFQNIRLLSPSEYKSKNEFPRTTHNLKYDRFKCSMCTIFPATKITEEEIISGFSPCYFCDNCFRSFHSKNTDVIAREYLGTPGGTIRK